MSVHFGSPMTVASIKFWELAEEESGANQTWIELPPELRPEWWKGNITRPVVFPVRALCGHPMQAECGKTI